MPVICIRTYEARCDGAGDPGARDCILSCGNYLDRHEVWAEALGTGWLEKGRKLYCPACRKRHEKQPPPSSLETT